MRRFLEESGVGGGHDRKWKEDVKYVKRGGKASFLKGLIPKADFMHQ